MLLFTKKLLAVVLGIIPIALSAQEQQFVTPDQFIQTQTIINGKEAVTIKVPGTPPPSFRMPITQPAKSAVLLSNVPAYDWSFGCSATSASMMAGYYDNNGYPVVYTGPANGGLAPQDNSLWGTATINGQVQSLCPLSATMMGLDGRTTRGHVDDYWTGNSDPDPFITNGWTQHTYGDCTGDFMKTNQSSFGNIDGSTIFTYFVDGGAFGNISDGDGGYGLKLFFESRGCPVTGYYNQYILGYNGLTQGFGFNDYTSMIDMGFPVMIQVAGHTMLGVGYDLTGNKVLLHDTWDYGLHEMVWGDSYAGMQHYGVTVISFPCPAVTSITQNFSSFAMPACWSQSYSGALESNRWGLSNSSNAGGTANEMRCDWTGKIGISRLITKELNTTSASQVNLSFTTFYDDWGTGATLKIQSSSDLINWTDEGWTYATGTGDIVAGTVINTQVTHNLGATTYIAWVIDGDHYQFDNWFIDNVMIDIPAAYKQLQVNVLLEGLFNGTAMNQASNGSGNQFAGDIADQISVELHAATSPYTINGLPLTVNVSTSGMATTAIPVSVTGSNYIVVKHRNSIETWSAVPVDFNNSIINYNFTDAANKAYGNNLLFSSGKYLIYSGDVNQDGAVDGLDMIPVDNQAANFGTGYIPEDINGDGSIDALDMIVLDNNAAAFVAAILP
jgi:hypothetical protein